jgi:SpoIID/LytB domain protein
MPQSTRHRGSTVRGRLGRGVLAGALALTACLVPTTAAPASAALGTTVTIKGHGFGHGIGMSQYGAYGAARAGKTHRQILDFYYPGTSWGLVTGLVRVLVTADTTTDVVVSPRSGLRVTDLGAKKTYPLPTDVGATRWRLNVAGTSSVVEYLDGRWRRWNPPGRTTLVGDGQFQADGPMTLWLPSGTRTYRGKLRAASPTPGSAARDTVNIVSLDTYVKGVLPAEMPASWPTEAVRSQAVAARTYASWSRAQNFDRYYQICDTTACQVYKGMSAEDYRGNAAVAATKRQILTWNGAPAFTQFSASSGGWTAAGSTPFLKAQADPWDRHSGNGVHTWTVKVSRAKFEKAYPRLGRLKNIRVLSRTGDGHWGGRVKQVRLVGAKTNVTISGDSFRWLAGLRSNWFTVVR